MVMRRIIAAALATITILALFTGSCSAKRYNGVAEDSPYYSIVKQATILGLMHGYSANLFGPEGNVTRGEMAQALYNRYGTQAKRDFRFFDVEDDAWYSEAIAWASESKVMEVIGSGIFDPMREMTREEIVSVLYGMTGRPDVNVNVVLAGYSDLSDISEWAKKPMAWAVEKGLIRETSPSSISPGKLTIRAEFAEIVVRYVKRVEKAPVSE